MEALRIHTSLPCMHTIAAIFLHNMKCLLINVCLIHEMSIIVQAVEERNCGKVLGEQCFKKLCSWYTKRLEEKCEERLGDLVKIARRTGSFLVQIETVQLEDLACATKRRTKKAERKSNGERGTKRRIKTIRQGMNFEPEPKRMKISNLSRKKLNIRMKHNEWDWKPE